MVRYGKIQTAYSITTNIKVVLKPAPENILELYLGLLQAIGIPHAEA